VLDSVPSTPFPLLCPPHSVSSSRDPGRIVRTSDADPTQRLMGSVGACIAQIASQPPLSEKVTVLDNSQIIAAAKQWRAANGQSS